VVKFSDAPEGHELTDEQLLKELGKLGQLDSWQRLQLLTASTRPRHLLAVEFTRKKVANETMSVLSQGHRINKR
jgi:hypothetical protein